MAPSAFMQLALAAAERVRGSTSPNPWVGCVLVRDGRVLATGATSPPGGAHAEAAALAAAGDARGASAYVTLEPCAPYDGKRTAPCALALAGAGVSRVVVALEDPDPNVRGRGLELLRQSGVEVEAGDGREAAIALLRPYLKHRATGLPYVFAKFAASLDGRIATRSGESKWITGPEARERGHEQRAWVDAIIAGSGTVLGDDPSLTARPGGQLAPHQPARVILDARGRTPPGARMLKEPGHTIIAAGRAARRQWKEEITAAGATIIECESDRHGVNLDQLFEALGRRGIMSAWCEGGASVLGSLFDGDQVDEVWVFLAPMLIGGEGRVAVAGEGTSSLGAAWRLREVVVERPGQDILVRGYTGRWAP